MSVSSKISVVDNSNVYLLHVGISEKESKDTEWYGFWDAINSIDFPDNCDICRQKMRKEDAIFFAKGKWIGSLHKKCYNKNEKKVDEIIKTLSEEKISESIKAL